MLIDDREHKMDFIDFIYDGVRLSSKGLVLCLFEKNEDVVEVGNIINLNATQPVLADHAYAIGPMYDQQAIFSFEICRDNCSDLADYPLSDIEIRDIFRWLNRKGFHKFRAIYRDGEFSDCFYWASFPEIRLIKIGRNVIGFSIQMNCNAPYAYGDPRPVKGTVDNSGTRLEIEDDSDELGYVYLFGKIKALSGGDLEIRNELDPGYVVAINNVTAQEEIEFAGPLKQAKPLQVHHKFPNDFNYNFPRLVSKWDDQTNCFYSNIPCEFDLYYYPIRKVGLAG